MGHLSPTNGSGIYQEAGSEVVECHMRALSTPSANDRPRFHTNIPVSELIEQDTQAIEASVVYSSHPVAKTEDEVTPIRPQGAQGLEPPDPRSRDRGSKVGPRRAQGRLAPNNS